MKRVMLVTYAYPPNGSPGALRAAKFAKYLPAHGWEPVVVTPAHGYARVAGLADHVALPGVRVVHTGDLGWLKRRMAGPGAAPAGLPAPRRAGGARAALVRLAHRLSIPDRNITWLPYALSAALREARARRPDVVLSTSPCITSHLVAGLLARRLGVPWVADFRDLWTLGAIYAQPRWRAALERRLERWILRRATRVVTVANEYRADFSAHYPDAAGKLVVIRNGFDAPEFAGEAPPVPDDRFDLVYAGSFYGGDRDPSALFQAMAALQARGVIDAARFRLRVIGVPEPGVVAGASAHGVAGMVEHTGPLSYLETVGALRAASALLLITHRRLSSIPVKLYDYLGARRPILSLSPRDFEVSGMIRDEQAGVVCEIDDVAAIAGWIEAQMASLRERGAPPAPPAQAGSRFTRAAVAAELAALLDSLARPAAPPREARLSGDLPSGAMGS